MTTQNPNQRPIPARVSPLTTPFGNIALAFSGGGFRAASFALGTLAYLKKAGLLERVTYMSSASGGTIATAMYALNNAQGSDFGTFYAKLHDNLEGVDLLDEVFKILNDKDAWKERPYKRRNFINSFAMTYDKLLFAGNDLGALTGSKTTHLQEVCFNTTEFYRGILFRQTVKMQPDSKDVNNFTEAQLKDDAVKKDSTYLYGNFIINLKHDAAKNLKLADLLAASSCFPGGFEPIIFPDDFENKNTLRHSTDEEKKKDPHRYLLSNLAVEPQELNEGEMELLYGKAGVERIKKDIPKPVNVEELQRRAKQEPLQGGFKAGLMDGGITDNQGVESMLRANDRRVKGETDFKPFDLMMVCDVGSHFMDPYKLPEDTPPSWMTIGRMKLLCWLLTIAGVAAIWWGAKNAPGTMPVLAILLGTLLTTAGLLVNIGLVRTKHLLSGGTDGAGLNLNKTFSDDIVKMMFKYFRSTPFSVLKLMFTERGSSMFILNNSVFLKRIRQLLYQRFFDVDKCSDREKASHVYDLSFTNDTNRLENDPKYLAPSRDLQLVAEQAFNMGTTLWFDEDSKKAHTEAALIACGQFTTCYNLLVYIDRLKYNKKGEEDTPEDSKDESNKRIPPYFSFSPGEQRKLDELETLMADHYEAFKKDPYWLYNEQGKAYIKDWREYKPVYGDLPDNFKGLR